MIYKIVAILLIAIVSIVWAISRPNHQPNLIQSEIGQRIITTDWTTGETLLALNAPLVGIGDKEQYATWVINPQIGDEVVDLGLRSQPNLEVIVNIKPTIFISSTWSQGLISKDIMPITSAAIDFYNQNGISWQSAVVTTQELAKLVNRENEAKNLIADTQLSFEHNAKQLTSLSNHSFAIIQFIDSRHMRIYGDNSLYGVVLKKLNLHNVWHKSANAWGFDQIGLLELAQFPEDTLLIIVKPYPANVYQQLQKNILWQKLPFSDPNRYRILPAVWAFGALPSMQRFSDMLTDALITPATNVW